MTMKQWLQHNDKNRHSTWRSLYRDGSTDLPTRGNLVASQYNASRYITTLFYNLIFILIVYWYCGGVVALSSDLVDKINGFANSFYGWVLRQWYHMCKDPKYSPFSLGGVERTTTSTTVWNTMGSGWSDIQEIYPGWPCSSITPATRILTCRFQFPAKCHFTATACRIWWNGVRVRSF